MGPACVVLFPSVLSDDLRESIRTDLASLGTIAEREGRGFDLQLADARPLGAHLLRTPRPVDVCPGSPQSEYEEVELAQIESAVGFRPVTALAIAMGCNTSDDHVLLAHLALHFADKHSGIIDFAGALLPQRLPPRFSFLNSPWNEVSEHFRAMVKDLPGRLWEFPYVTANGKQWVSHAGDPTFVRAWMSTPGFHMVK